DESPAEDRAPGAGEVSGGETSAGATDSTLFDGRRPLPAGAHPEILDRFREAEARPFSPSDGQGTATLTPTDPVRAGSFGTFTIRYRAGPAGIAPGGSLVLQVSPFWGWSDPQPFEPGLPGFTTVETTAPGTRLAPEPCGSGCLRIGIEEVALPARGEITVRYGGEGAGAAQVDRFAESEEEFFLRVDGDGDDVAAPLADMPSLRILPGPARALRVVVPSTAREGDEVWVQIAALDAVWSAAADFTGEVAVEDAGGLAGLPARIAFGPEHAGQRRLRAVAERPGVGRVRLTVDGWQESFASNPLVVAARGAEAGPRILWADLHGHSGRSDGTGTPAEFLRYARDVAALDVAALTDHDHFGLRFLDRTPALWEEIRETTEAFHEPGRFVTLLGFEWTNWIFGHRHVLWFEGRGELIGSTDAGSDEPEELWARLAGKPAVTIAHHPGGGPVPIDWSVPPDPELEPVVEIVSVHGSSECLECPERIYSAVPGAFVQDALGRGFRLGILGSGDTHDGHPGVGSPENRTIGLAAILAERLERGAILEALRARRVYATSGPRIVLHFDVSDTPMGGVLRVSDPSAPREIGVRVVGTAPLAHIDCVKNGEVLFSVEGDGDESLELFAEDSEVVRTGEYLYVRVAQVDGGLAWSSPVWMEVGP
ncbi:MAG: CehA/McbA family metallohydrolase, partial [Candidatus Rokubacteria bacterium]|nr:CehA/McbA family metallohydrolase [Candidatus Rokubacteria bacterium]